MYQALCGRPPFGGDSMHALIISISTQEHMPLSARRPDLPIRLAMVVERALQKSPDQRWQTADEMATALRQALAHGERTADGAVRVAPPPAAIAATELPLTMQEARLPHALIAGIALLIALLGVGGALVLRMRPSAPAASAGVAFEPPPAATKPVATPSKAAPTTTPTTTTTTTATTTATTAATAPGAATPVAARATASAKALDASALGNVLQAHQSELQRCYENAVVASLGAPGAAADTLARVRLDVALALAQSGKVDRVGLTGEAPEELKTCVSQAISRFEFPPSDRPSDLTFPVLFQREIVQR
jgi:hypothetical protein